MTVENETAAKLAAALPAQVQAAVTIRFMVPKSMPPRFGSYAKGAIFASDALPEADVRAMLRQKTLVPYVAPADAAPAAAAPADTAPTAEAEHEAG